MTSTQQRISQISALLPPWVDLDRLQAAHAELNQHWRTRGNYDAPVEQPTPVAPVIVAPIAVCRPASLPAGERDFQRINCLGCGGNFQATGSRQQFCVPCGKERKRERRALWLAAQVEQKQVEPEETQ